MTFARRIPKPTKEEQRRQDKARELGCIHCHMQGLIRWNDEGVAYSPAGAWELNHLTTNGFTTSQNDSVMSCTWHHRGVCRPGNTTSIMTDKFGPSLAKGTVPFYAEFGRNSEQKEFQDQLIAGAEAIGAVA